MTYSDKYYMKKLINKIISLGYGIAIHDGEELIQFDEKLNGKYSKITDCPKVAINALNTTGEDILRVIDLSSDKPMAVASFYAIYNNGFNMDSMEGVICDYSENEIANNIVNSI